MKIINNPAKYQDPPAVSVLMAVNEINLFLSSSIQSILNQEYRNFEFIVICNGAKRTEIKRYIEEHFDDKRILIFEIEMAGLAFALNYGICVSKGVYIARHDSDDISLSDRLGKQVEWLNHNKDYAVVGCRVSLIDEKGDLLSDTFPFFESDRCIRAILPIHNPLCHPALMFRRDILLKVNGYLFGYFSEDHDLFIRIANCGSYKFKNLTENLFQYRRHQHQLTEQRGIKVFAEITGFLIINIIARGNFKSLLGIIWVLPPIIFLKRFMRTLIRRYL